MCFGGTISVLVATKTEIGKTNAVFVLSEREMKKSNTILKIFFMLLLILIKDMYIFGIIIGYLSGKLILFMIN